MVKKRRETNKSGSRMENSRRRGPIFSEHKHILVVTEGLCTEPQYFDQLAQGLKDKNIVIHCIPKLKKKRRENEKWKSDPLSVVKKAIEERDARVGEGKSKFVECFAIVDVDEWGDNLTEAIQLAREKEITVIVSNPCFEVWLAMHLSKNCPSEKTKIKNFVEEKGLVTKGQKALTSNFPKQKYELACANAKAQWKSAAANKIGPVPSTAMPVFFDLVKRHFSED